MLKPGHSPEHKIAEELADAKEYLADLSPLVGHWAHFVSSSFCLRSVLEMRVAEVPAGLAISLT